MCACRQKKSFFIEDILQDVKKKPYKNLSNEPTKPLICNKKEVPKKEEVNTRKETSISNGIVSDLHTDNYKDYEFRIDKDLDEVNTKLNEENVIDNGKFHKTYEQEVNYEKVNEYKFNVKTEVQNEIEFSKISWEQRRNTYPLYPMPIKAWQHKKEMFNSIRMEPRFSYYSDPLLNSGGLLRNQLALNRFVTHPYTIRQAYGFDRVPPNCCSPWWGLGSRRKGGQVRFTAAQTGALERRFNASKYLSPDERRALATSLRLSDRQVKTWFQNRRAKWRRTTPDSADAGSPPTADEGSDDEIHRVDDD